MYLIGCNQSAEKGRHAARDPPPEPRPAPPPGRDRRRDRVQVLRSLPDGATSHLLELAGLGAGIVFGLASIPLFRVGKDESGRLTNTAGAAYAALWLSALVARLAFAYGSSDWFHGELAAFSVANYVPAAAYASAFVLMVLTMVAIRTAAVLVRSRVIGAELKAADSGLLRRLHAA